jgi:signal transduction histidine kinase
MTVESHLEDRERQRLEAQYSEIAELAGGLAHEIKNPLSTISLNLDLMAEELAEGETARDRRLTARVQSMQQECKRLNDVLGAFLQFARAGEIELVEGDLNTLVREFIDTFQPQAAERGIEISPHLASDLPRVKLDRSLMRQVLLNLALNARDAMPHGGLLELQTYERGGRVHLDLIDTGIGIEPRVLPTIFRAFVSSKATGSGLGLPTARKIVEAHGGTLSCESEPGRGTRFTVSLPTADELTPA